LNILLKLMSVVALVIAPSIAMNATGVANYVNDKEKAQVEITMNVESADIAKATVVTTTIVNGEEVREEKVLKGTEAEVKAQLETLEKASVKTDGKETEITVAK